MRLLALINDSVNDSGGISRFNCDLLTALAASSRIAEVTVVARASGPSRGRSTNLPRSVLEVRRPGKLSYGCSAAALAAWRRPDVIFCGHLHIAPLAAALAAALNIPWWLHVHGIEAWSAPGTIRRWAVQRATLVTAASRYTRRQFLQWADIDPTRVKVLPNTVDDRFHSGPKHMPLLEALGLKGRTVLLTVGRLASEERYKGHDRVIQILPHLLRDYPDLCYLIVGGGGDRDRLEALAHQSGVATHVTFLGHATGEELPEIYRVADVFVMPSDGEGFGIVFLEAAASGLPVVASGRAGAADAAADGELAVIAEPPESTSLIQAILKALHDRPRFDVRRFSRPHFDAHVHRLIARLSRDPTLSAS